MTYSTRKPDAGPSPKVDVNQIRENFASFLTVFSANHTALNASTQGCHTNILFQTQTSNDDVPGGTANMFSKSVTNATSTQPHLFTKVARFLPNGNNSAMADNVPLQLTYNKVSTTGPIYQSFMIGGYLLFMGQTNNIAADIVLTPSPSRILSVIPAAHNMKSSGGAPYDVAAQVISNTTFRIRSSLNGSGPAVPYLFTYLAIGLQ